ncbi:helix-turn-helix transcriptional regulator [Streptomyces sp. NBC_00252]|uniref:helix-turn-helix domain-containing protein n=1 Tax=Streptomyces sp. NBC_00252 TaxID=2975691 RepID=UPI002E27CF78|nr:helix-turn-helix transcriptional regulator [Streptomyces sp. NBC_00252]
MSEEPEPANGLEWFGQELAAALDHKGATQQELADFTGYKAPYVSKVKNGKALPSFHFAEGCDHFFNTPGSFARLLIRISQHGHPEWFVPYVELEKSAAKIEDYSTSFVMGMLQTPEYAQAVFRAAHPRETEGQIKARVELRLRRRDVLDRPEPPFLWVIFHEAVLRTTVGTPGTMAGQLQHLVQMAESPHVTLQVLAFEAGAPASGLPFILLTPDDGATVLYSETTGKGAVNDSPSAVRDWSATYERLRAAAESETRSLALIHSIMEEHAR